MTPKELYGLHKQTAEPVFVISKGVLGLVSRESSLASLVSFMVILVD